MSVLWDFEQGAQALEGLSLAVGVAVRRALIELGLEDVRLKWPNDIYIGHKKLGGILLEMIGDPAGHCSVVIGVGINVSMPASMAVNIDQPWTDCCSESDAPIGRSRLAALLIDNIFDILDDFEPWVSLDIGTNGRRLTHLKGSKGQLALPGIQSLGP